MTYTHRAQKFIRLAIRQRRALISSRVSKKNIALMNRHCTTLQNYLNAYRYTDKQMAGFFIRHSNEIREILPGENSKAHEKILRTYYDLYYEAKQLIERPVSEPKLFQPEIINSVTM